MVLTALRSIALLALLVVGPWAVADKPYSGRWKIEADHHAKSAGTISFGITFEPGADGKAKDPLAADIPIPKGMHEGKVIQSIENTLKAILEPKGFKIKSNLGDLVTVKATGDTPDFQLTLTGNSVQGVEIEIEQ